MSPVESPPGVSVTRRRVRPRAWAASPAFRVVVPVVLGVLAMAAAVVAVLAAAVLMGFLPYPGR